VTRTREEGGTFIFRISLRCCLTGPGTRPGPGSEPGPELVLEDSGVHIAGTSTPGPGVLAANSDSMGAVDAREESPGMVNLGGTIAGAASVGTAGSATAAAGTATVGTATAGTATAGTATAGAAIAGAASAGADGIGGGGGAVLPPWKFPNVSSQAILADATAGKGEKRGNPTGSPRTDMTRLPRDRAPMV
jgi:hypothetical protein